MYRIRYVEDDMRQTITQVWCGSDARRSSTGVKYWHYSNTTHNKSTNRTYTTVLKAISRFIQICWLSNKWSAAGFSTDQMLCVMANGANTLKTVQRNPLFNNVINFEDNNVQKLTVCNFTACWLYSCTCFPSTQTTWQQRVNRHLMLFKKHQSKVFS